MVDNNIPTTKGIGAVADDERSRHIEGMVYNLDGRVTSIEGTLGTILQEVRGLSKGKPVDVAQWLTLGIGVLVAVGGLIAASMSFTGQSVSTLESAVIKVEQRLTIAEAFNHQAYYEIGRFIEKDEQLTLHIRALEERHGRSEARNTKDRASLSELRERVSGGDVARRAIGDYLVEHTQRTHDDPAH